MKEKLIIIGRWLLVLPTFIVAYLIVYLVMWLSYRFWSDGDSWALKYFLPIIGSGVSGFYSIVYAAKVAPTYKNQTAFVILVVMILFTGATLYYEFFLLEEKRWISILAIIASMIGNIIGYQMSKDETALKDL